MPDAVRSLFARFNPYYQSMRSNQVGRLIVLSLLIGIPTGLVASVFNHAIEYCIHFFQHGWGNYVAPALHGEGGDGVVADGPLNRWVLFVLPAIGGLVSGWLVYQFAPEAEGHGTDGVIDAFHYKQGKIRGRVPFIKILASAVTIGTGGCAGREGPVAQVGAGLASNLAAWMHLSHRECRLLLIAGAGAGIGAIFRAPLGGALFAVEVLYRDSEFEFEALIPTFIASIVAYSVYCPLSGHGWGAIFEAGDFFFRDPSLLVFYAVLALTVFGAGRLYIEVFYAVRNRFFRPMRLPNMLKPAIGGLLLGCLALLFSFLTSPEKMGAVYGAGYGYLQQAINGELTLKFLLMLALFKILACSLTIGSGGSGGVFGPSIVIGGLVGGALGVVGHRFFPEIIDPSTASAFALVGMAGFFSGVANTPIAALLMISEMTAGYTLLVPLMLVTIISYSLSFRRRSIYEKQVFGRIDSPAHTGDFVTDVLDGIRVGAVVHDEPLDVVNVNTAMPAIMEQIESSRFSCFPVVDDAGTMVGMISLNDIRAAFLDPELAQLLLAQDIAESGFEPILLDETLNDALRKFVASNREELPVVERDAPDRVLAMLDRRDLMVAYNQAMQKLTSKQE